MMKFWKRLLAVPEDDKVTEKCMTRVLICSICSVLLCVVCLVSTTWAWYETQETCEGSVIRGGHWEYTVNDHTPVLPSEPSESESEVPSEPIESEPEDSDEEHKPVDPFEDPSEPETVLQSETESEPDSEGDLEDSP